MSTVLAAMEELPKRVSLAAKKTKMVENKLGLVRPCSTKSSWVFFGYTPKKTNMSPEKGPFQLEISSSKHQIFRGKLFDFRGDNLIGEHAVGKTVRMA